MPGCQNSRTEALIAGQAHRGNDICRAGGHYHERRVLVGVQVERLLPLILTLFARRVCCSQQTGPEPFEHRAVDDLIHAISFPTRFLSAGLYPFHLKHAATEPT